MWAVKKKENAFKDLGPHHLVRSCWCLAGSGSAGWCRRRCGCRGWWSCSSGSPPATGRRGSSALALRRRCCWACRGCFLHRWRRCWSPSPWRGRAPDGGAFGLEGGEGKRRRGHDGRWGHRETTNKGMRGGKKKEDLTPRSERCPTSVACRVTRWEYGRGGLAQCVCVCVLDTVGPSILSHFTFNHSFFAIHTLTL